MTLNVDDIHVYGAHAALINIDPVCIFVYIMNKYNNACFSSRCTTKSITPNLAIEILAKYFIQ